MARKSKKTQETVEVVETVEASEDPAPITAVAEEIDGDVGNEPAAGEAGSLAKEATQADGAVQPDQSEEQTNTEPEAAAEAAEITELEPAPAGDDAEPRLETSGEMEESPAELHDLQLEQLVRTPLGLKGAVEALLFSSPEPLTARRMANAIGLSDVKLVNAMVQQLRNEYDEQRRGLQIMETAHGYQMATREVFGDFILQLRGRKRRPPLSPAALETLAIVAYRQPVIRSEVEAIRGVESSGTLRNLIDMGLVEVSGKRDVLGRPPEYGTTEQFLQSFGLRSLAELPPIAELKRQMAAAEAKAALASAATSPSPAAELAAAASAAQGLTDAEPEAAQGSTDPLIEALAGEAGEPTTGELTDEADADQVQTESGTEADASPAPMEDEPMTTELLDPEVIKATPGFGSALLADLEDEHEATVILAARDEDEDDEDFEDDDDLEDDDEDLDEDDEDYEDDDDDDLDDDEDDLEDDEDLEDDDEDLDDEDDEDYEDDEDDEDDEDFDDEDEDEDDDDEKA